MVWRRESELISRTPGFSVRPTCSYGVQLAKETNDTFREGRCFIYQAGANRGRGKPTDQKQNINVARLIGRCIETPVFRNYRYRGRGWKSEVLDYFPKLG